MAQKKATPDTIGEPGSDAPSAHHRPEYPSPGCVPAEPDSVSPGTSSVLILAHSCKVHRTPEGCLENPGFLGPGAHCSGGDPQILRRSQKSKAPPALPKLEFAHISCFPTTPSLFGSPRSAIIDSAALADLTCDKGFVGPTFPSSALK